MSIILDLLNNQNTSNGNNPLEGPPTKKSIMSGLVGNLETINVGSQSSLYGFAPNPNYDLSDENTETRLNTDLEDWGNRFKQAWDETQKSAYTSKRNDAQNTIDKNVGNRVTLDYLLKHRKINRDTYDSRLEELSSMDIEASQKLKDAQEGIDTNQEEIDTEYVSKIYKLKEALANSKGADAGFGEALQYTMPSGLGSMGSMMAQQMIATFGRKALTSAVTRGLVAAGLGIETGPGALLIGAVATVGQMALLWNARNQESLSETGDAAEQAKSLLTEEWFAKNNPDHNPEGLQPSEEDLRKIRMTSMKGIDDLYRQNMMLLIPDALGMVIGSSLFKGSSIIKGLGNVGSYNKYTRVAKTATIGYTGMVGEKFEEGYQYAAGQRQSDVALGLANYQDKGFMKNVLTDATDTLASINYGLPYQADTNLGGKYAKNKEFQASSEVGGLLGLIGGGAAGGIAITRDINKYLEVSSDLKNKGVANIDDKVFKLKTQMYLKHFQNDTVHFLLEGVRNLTETKDEKGVPLMSEYQAQEEVKNIVEAHQKYKEVSEHLENIIPEGTFSLKKTEEQKMMIAAARLSLLHTSLQLTRHSKAIQTIPNINNINNLIEHQQKIVTDIQDTIAADPNLNKLYNLDSRLENAKKYLESFEKQKQSLMEEFKLTEKEIPAATPIEESNKNKEYLIENLNLNGLQKNYEDLLKIKGNESLKKWFSGLTKQREEKAEALGTPEGETGITNPFSVEAIVKKLANGETLSEEEELFRTNNSEEVNKKLKVHQLTSEKARIQGEEKELNRLIEREKNAKSISQVIGIIKDKLKYVRTKLVNKEETIAYVEGLLSETTDLTLEQLQELTDILDNFAKKEKLNTNESKKKESITKFVKSEFQLLNDIQNRVKELKEQLALIKEYEQDYAKQIQYYESLLADPNLSTLSVKEIKDKISKVEKKLTLINKLIDGLRSIINNTLEYLKSITDIILQRSNKLDYWQKQKHFKVLDALKLKEYIDSNINRDVDIKLLEEYAANKKQFDALEADLLQALDAGDITEAAYNKEKDRLVELTNKAVVLQRQLRYLNALITPINSAIKAEPVSNITKPNVTTARVAEIDKQLAELAVVPEVISTIDENPETINKPYYDGDPKKTSIYTTESGLDTNRDEASSRLFRYIENNKITDQKLLVVTKKNNLKLYNEILAEKKDSKEFEDDYKKRTGKEYEGIWVIITDKNGAPIKVDGKLLFTTLTSESRITKGHIIIKTGTKEQAIKNLNAFQAKLLSSTEQIFLPILGKSKGIAQLEAKIPGTQLRPSFNVLGRIADTLRNVPLFLSKVGIIGESTIAPKGKLYTRTPGGNYIDLIPRNINQEEINKIINLLAQAVKKELSGVTQSVESATKEIEKLIFLGIKKEGADQFTLAVKKNNIIQIEDKEYKATDIFTQDGRLTPTGEQTLLPLLNRKKVHVNNAYDIDVDFEFEGPTLTTGEGVIYNSYKEFLLQGETPMFGTDLVTMDNVQFKNQYLNYENNVTVDEKLAPNPKPTTTDVDGNLVVTPMTAAEMNTASNTSTDAKADIERRVNNTISKVFGSESLFDFNTNQPGKIVNNQFIPDNLGSQLFDAINKTLKGEVVKTDKVEAERLFKEYAKTVHPDKNQSEESNIIAEAFFKAMSTAKEQGRVDILTELKNKFDAELAALNNKGTTTRAKKDTDGLKRLAEKASSKRALTEREISWFKTKFPNIPIEVVKGLIDGESFGKFLSAGKVLLSDEATNGTLYHEAFHAVTQLYLSKKQIDALYKEAGEKLGTTDRLTIEEYLAEDFFKYKETGKILGQRPQRNTTFRKILDFIRALFRLDAKSIEEIYNRLDKGYYTNKDIVGVREFSTLNKLAGKSVAYSKQILDAIDAIFFERAFINNLTPDEALDKSSALLGSTYNQILEREEVAKDEISKEAYNYIIDNWEEVSTTWQKRAAAIGIEIDLNEDPNKEQDEEAKGRDTAYGEANQVSAKSTLSSASKLLIRSLKQKNADGTDKLSDLNLPQVVEFGNTYNFLLKELSGLSSYSDIYNRIEELSKTRPEFIDLKDRIGKEGTANSMEKFIFQQQFRQDFAKNQVNSHTTVIEADGKIYIIENNKQSRIDKIREGWKNASRGNATQNDAGQLILNLNIIDIPNNIKFLSALGINFSKETLPELTDNQTVTDTVQYIKEYLETQNPINKILRKLTKNIKLTAEEEGIKQQNLTEIEKILKGDPKLVNLKTDVTDLFSTKYGESPVSGRIDSLLELEAEFNPNVTELSYMSTEGKTIYSIGLNSMLSIIKNGINNTRANKEQIAAGLSDRDVLFARFPHLNTVGTEGSLWFSKLFSKDGFRREGINLELDLHDGLKTNNIKGGEFKQSTKGLSIGDKYVQEITSILMDGRSSYLRASDKSTEATFRLTKYAKGQKLAIPIADLAKGFDIQSVKEIFRGYFKSELKRIALFEIQGLGANIDVFGNTTDKDGKQVGNKGAKFTVFEGILDAKLKKSIYEQIQVLKTRNLSETELGVEIDNLYKQVQSQVDAEVIKYFDTYTTELLGKIKEFKVDTNGISRELYKETSSEKQEDKVKQLIRAVAVNDYINSIEQTKLFIGDMAFYKDLFKRTAGATGTKETSSTGENIDNWLNANNTRKDKKLANGKVNAVIYEDVVVASSYVEEYKKALISFGYSPEEADILLKAYGSMDEGDAQGWITLDEYKEFALRRGVRDPKLYAAIDKAQKQIWKDGKLTNKETLLTKDEIASIHILKAQYFGPQELNGLFAPAYHKYSLLPLVPQLVQGRNLEVMLNHMTDSNNQIGYALFKSGSKVGTPTNAEGKANSFYNENGEINTGNLQKQTIFYDFLGLQVKSSDVKDKVTFGTQFRKLLFSNAFGFGEEAIEGSRALLDEYNKIIDEIVEAAKAKLIKNLGINPASGKIEDATKLIALLRKEAEDRNLPDNIIDFLNTEIVDGLTVVENKLDASVNIAKINSMITSLVNTRLIKQKMNGDALIQVSSSGMESIGKRNIKEDKTYKFYTKNEDGTTNPAECAIPITGQYAFLLEQYGSLDNVNRAIRKGLIGKEILELVGYRIPTQGMNSIEYLTIKEFLPADSATAIILPSEIVAKSGGDFDVDKLNIFKPNLQFRNGEVVYVTKQSREQIGELYDLLKQRAINKELKKTDAASDKLLSAILGTDVTVLSEEDIYEILEEEKLPTNKEEFIKNFNHNKSRQNKIIEIAKQQISHSSNFTALITPNSTKILTDIVNDFRYYTDYLNRDRKENKEVMTKEEYLKSLKDNLSNIRYSDQLKLTTKIDQFHKFLLAKEMIGIAATANTHHILAQMVGMTLNPTYTVGGEKVSVKINLFDKSIGEELNIGRIKDAEGKHNISEVISQIINAVVDAAKDPFFFDLNMSMETLGTQLYLIRLGVPYENVAYFMKQPIITDYLKALAINKSGFLKGTKGAVLNNTQLEESIKKEYLSKEEREGLTSKILTTENLRSLLLKENQKSKEFNETQIQVLEDFLAYKEQSQMLGAAAKATNMDTAGLGKDIAVSERKITEILSVKEIGFVNNIDDVLQKTMIKSFNQHQFAIDIFSPLYHVQGSKKAVATRNAIMGTLNPFGAENTNKLSTLIDNDFINYVVQNYGYLDKEDNSAIEEFKKKLFTGENTPAKKLLDLKNKLNKSDKEQKLVDNMFIKELFPIIRNADRNQDNIKIYLKRYDTFTANQLTEAFREVGEIDLPLAKELYKELMDLGILQSGLNNSPITYLGILPQEYYAKIVKNAFKQFDKKSGVEDYKAYQQLFFRNNYSNSLVNNYAYKTGIKELGEGMFGKDYNKALYAAPATSVNTNNTYTPTSKEVTEKPSDTQFSYKGKTINTEFKLGEEQEQALKDLIDFVDSGNKNHKESDIITLQGAAGTGKTSIIGYLEKYYKGSYSFAYLAPTHAATAELAFATVKSGNTVLPSTLMSSLTVNPRTKKSVFSAKIAKRLGFNPVVVIDESSMLDIQDINKLKEAIENVGGKLIYLGDEKQISKVVQGNVQNKSVSPAFTNFRQLSLTKIFRQSENSLLTLLSKMREQKSFKLFQVPNNESVKFLNRKEYNKELIKDLQTNSENTMIISYTNNAVKDLNDAARKVLGREGETKVGDIIVGYLGYASKQVEKADIANSINYTISNITTNGSVKTIEAKSSKLAKLIALGIKGIKETAYTNYYQLSSDDSLTFDDLTEKDFNSNNSDVSRIFKRVHEATTEYQNKTIGYGTYLDILAATSETLRKYSVGADYIYNPATNRMEKLDKNKHQSIKQNGQGSLLFSKDVDYGHAITIHKSQGSTIDNVYFDTSSLKAATNTPIIDSDENQITTEKMSLAYVAMSRSKNKLVISIEDNDFEMLQVLKEAKAPVTKQEEQPYIVNEGESEDDETTESTQQPTSKGEVKPGVSELFESNPELANAVYEALGFIVKSKVETTKTSIDIRNELLSKQEQGQISLAGEDIDIIIQSRNNPTEENIQKLKKLYNNEIASLQDSIINEITPQQKQQAQEQYSQYLDTVFPDSKVKDIVYHDTDAKFDEFNSRRGIYFNVTKEAGFTNTLYKIAAIINLKNPAIEDMDSYGGMNTNEVFPKNDGVIGTDSTKTIKGEYIVSRPSQIHILGNKQDIEGFKNFVTQPSTSVKANVILPIGTSGSGKSTFIKSLPQENLVVISPDDMRVEFTGDINNKSKDKEIYIEAANRAIKAVKEGKQVVFDTTNLTKEKRKPFIEAIKKALPNVNIQYKLMPLDAELAKQRIKAQIARGENRANVSDETIDRHAESYKQMLEDIKSEGITNYDTTQSSTSVEKGVNLSDSQIAFAKKNTIEQSFFHGKPYKKADGKWDVYKIKNGIKSSIEGALKGFRTQTTRSFTQQEALYKIAENQGLPKGTVKGTIVWMEDTGASPGAKTESPTKGQGGWFKITSEFYTPNKTDFNNFENWEDNVWNDRSSEFKIGTDKEWKSIRFERATQPSTSVNEGVTVTRITPKNKELPVYELDKTMTNMDGTKRFASTVGGNTVRINPPSSMEEFFNYFEGKDESKTSTQKGLVLFELSMDGYSLARIKSILNTRTKVITFLILHEKSHIDNKDADVYWKQGKENLNTQDKIDIEARATLEAIKKIEQMYSNENKYKSQLDELMTEAQGLPADYQEKVAELIKNSKVTNNEELGDLKNKICNIGLSL